MGALDWIILSSFAMVLVLSAAIRPRAAHGDATDRFAAGRRMPWFVLGGSLAATSLSTDTPLLVSGAFYSGGLAGNWFWLAGVPGTLATLFFFARFWRRSGVLTKIEVLKLRYGDGPKTQWLRVAMAIFDAGLINVLVLSSVTYASYLLVSEFLGVSDQPRAVWWALYLSDAALLTIAALAFTVGYTMMAGFRAVVRTDIAQLLAAIVASIFVSVFAVNAGISEHSSYQNLIATLPNERDLFRLFQMSDPAIWLLLLFGWWQTAPGGGLFVQRLISARSETDATLTAFFYALLHYVARIWPWIAIGALALIYFPNLDDQELAYPLVAERFLPAGGIGLMTIAFVSAFMSTVDSRLNWGASYFVNDVYGAFGHDRNDKTAARIEAVTILLTAILAATIALTGALTSIIGVYKYLLILQAGAAFAAIARWYWWRLTIWAEIVALASSLVIGNALAASIGISENFNFAVVLSLNSVLCAAFTIITAILTSREGPNNHCRSFAQKTRVGGPGWRSVLGENESSNPTIRATIGLWLFSIVMIYGSIAFIAALITLNFMSAVWTGAILMVASFSTWLARASLYKALDFSTKN